MLLRLLVASVAVLLTACPEPMPTTDGGSGVAPVITSISPTSGPLAGNTSVTINGTNFVAGATVTFGGTAATLSFDTDRKLTAITPAGTSAGAVNVTVINPGGKSNTLNSAFTYENTVARTIRESVLQNPADTTDSSGGAMVSTQIIAHVEVPGSTPGAGAGPGVRAQVGFATTVSATPSASDFTWVDAMYVGDVDGAATGDLARDSYSGTVMVPGATTAQIIYTLAARFSVDGGQTWTIADRDGSMNGVTAAQLSRVTVVRASVEWCKLGGQNVEAPPTIALRGSAVGPTVYGQVFKTGITTAAGAGTNIKGALGYGMAGTDPSTWTWTNATFNVDTGGGQNDEFQAVLPNPGIGSYKFAFRFNHDDGPWSYCDADGLSTDGFTEAQAGSLTVAAIAIDSCIVQFPDAVTSYEGRPADNVYGRVFAQGVTDVMGGSGAGIEAQLGVGAGSDPTDAAWVWTNATFNTDVPNGGDEFQARITGPAPGTFAYAYRFRASGGGAWTYCDRDGSGNGVQAAQLGALTALPFNVSNCVLEATNAGQTRLPGAMTLPYFASVTVPTLTEGIGQGTPLTVEFGFGNVLAALPAWQWVPASFVADNAQADRYQFAIAAPMTTGSYATAFRVQVGSNPHVYCDLDGSMNGFDVSQAGRLTVASALISSCRLQAVSAFNLPSGSPLTSSARVLIPGVTANAGAAANLRVQIGVGPLNDNASSSTLWGWQNAAFSSDVAGEDEFALTAYPAYSGGRSVSARASLDGVSWVYCDLNGSDVNGYEINQQYDITVTNHVEFDFCNTQAPTSSPRGGNAFGQIYEPNITPNATAPIIAQFGVGAETEDPGLAWNWTAATFNVPVGNNNEYVAVVPDAGVGSKYAFRYSVDAGVWCYGDLNGSQNGFSGGANLGTIVP